jgi:hypothetical protein
VAKVYTITIKYKTPKGDLITSTNMSFKLKIYDPACNAPTINGANKVTIAQLAQQYYTLGTAASTITFPAWTTDPTACLATMKYSVALPAALTGKVTIPTDLSSRTITMTQ